MYSHPRQNGKQSLSAMQLIAGEFGAPLRELEAAAAKYRPTLEALGVLDGLASYEEVMLFVWLWRHDKEIEDATLGVADVRVEYDD